ncbi:MAG: hypothetical protein HY907_17235 [Deltaproteobacteria bacterium]|nr:hypothetical protein [Deltaproteobacteria bacterium]
MTAKGGRRRARPVALVAALCGVLGCSPDADSCVAGETRACACDGAAAGVQRCRADGAGWQECSCVVADADAGDGATDAADGGEDAGGLVDAGGVGDEAFGGEYPCLEPVAGSVDATVAVGDDVPPLGGGTIANGRYELTSVVLYPWSALAERVTRFLPESNGNTRGAVAFRDGAWGMSARLDLFVRLSIVALGGVELDLTADFEAAGPFEAFGGAIVGEPGECASSVPPECRLAGAFRYEAAADVVTVEVLWTRDCLRAALPYTIRHYSGMWIEGDMPVLLRFSR